MGGRQNAYIADTLQLRDVHVAIIFGFLYMGAHWRHLANTIEPSVCGGDAVLCQITLTTCSLCVTDMRRTSVAELTSALC